MTTTPDAEPDADINAAFAFDTPISTSALSVEKKYLAYISQKSWETNIKIRDVDASLVALPICHFVADIQHTVTSDYQQGKVDTNFVSQVFGCANVLRENVQKTDRKEGKNLSSLGKENEESILNIIENTDASPEAKQYVQKILKKNSSFYLECAKIGEKFKTNNIFQNWESGRFSYQEPIFKDLDEMNKFLPSIGRMIALMEVKRLSEYTQKISSDNSGQFTDATIAINCLFKRIYQHDKDLREREAGRQAAIKATKAEQEDRKAHAAESARQRAQREAEERRQFEINPQPYRLGVDAKATLNKIEELAGSTAKGAKRAKMLADIIHDALRDDEKIYFDQRGDGVKQLADLLFSNANLNRIATSSNLGGSFGDVPDINLPQRLKSLRILASMSGQKGAGHKNARDLIETLLNHPTGILLLAGLLGEVGTYPNILTDISDIKKRIEPLGNEIKDFSATDLEALKDDSTVQEYNQLQNSLDTTRKNLEKEHRELKDKLQPLILGKKVNREQVRAASAAISAQTRAAAPVHSDTPAAWQPVLNGTFGVEESERGNRYLRVFLNENPVLGEDVKAGAGLDKLREACQRLIDQHKVHIEVGDYIDHLKNTCHFKEVSRTENEVVLHHNEYEIDVRLNVNNRAESAKQYKQALKIFEQHRDVLQVMLLENARSAGIEIGGADEKLHAQGPIVIKHPTLGEKTIAEPHGYMNRHEFNMLQDWIDRIQNLPAQSDGAEPAQPSQEKYKWVPNDKEAWLILDTNALNSMSAIREVGLSDIRYIDEFDQLNKAARTEDRWLQLLKATAKLPNIKVIIPSTVADWELRGRIPTYDSTGKIVDFEVKNQSANNSNSSFYKHVMTPVKGLLDSASRAQIDEKGDLHFEEGENKNVIIMSTPGDRKLFDRIRSGENVYGQSEGEEGITRILDAMPTKSPVIVITNDRGYIRKIQDKTTSKGIKVGVYNTLSYMNAELTARGGEGIKKALKLESPVNIEIIGSDIETHRYFTKNRPKRGEGMNIHEIAPQQDVQEVEPAQSERKEYEPLARVYSETQDSNGNSLFLSKIIREGVRQHAQSIGGRPSGGTGGTPTDWTTRTSVARFPNKSGPNHVGGGFH